MSMERFDNLQSESEVYFKLQTVEQESELTNTCYLSKDILKAIKDTIEKGTDCKGLCPAQQDIAEIVRYISKELHTPVAADRLATNFLEAADRAVAFPYAAPSYYLIRP